MLIEVKVPQLSESVSEATLVTWHKKEGDAVSRDENLIDIETDKVVLETPAPADGAAAPDAATRPAGSCRRCIPPSARKKRKSKKKQGRSPSHGNALFFCPAGTEKAPVGGYELVKAAKSAEFTRGAYR